MASTPSAPALSAVLRCRGNIWTRNPPTKRPVPSVYSLGAAGEVICDSPAERRGSNEASAWEAFLQGGPVVVGKRLTVAIKSPQLMFLKLAVLSRSSSGPDDAPPHLLSQEDERSKTNALQANGQICSSTDPITTNSGSVQTVTEDRPD